MKTHQLRNHKTISAFLAIVFILIAFAISNYAASYPKAVLLDVPFTTQAPDNNWEKNENCEEASLVMANAFLNQNTADLIPPEVATDEMNQLIEWEKANLGYYLDTGAEDTAKIAQEVYNLHTKIIEDYSDKDIKQALADKKPVLLFVDGRKLINPNFTPPGPEYHVFLVRGYNEKGYIVNEPGSKEGKEFIYSYKNIHESAADWDQDAGKIDYNKKVALILSK